MTIPQWGKVGRQRERRESPDRRRLSCRGFWMLCTPSTRCAAALLVACFLAPSVASATCKCADVGSMLDRIAEATTAISAFQTAIGRMTDAEKTEKMGAAGVKTEYHGKLRSFVKAVLTFRRSANPGFRSYEAETSADCETHIDPNATSCLSDALGIHEQVHKKACDAHKTWIIYELVTGQTDWKNDLTLKDMAQEEIAGYQAEIDYLNQALSGAQQDCAYRVDEPIGEGHVSGTICSGLAQPFTLKLDTPVGLVGTFKFTPSGQTGGVWSYLGHFLDVVTNTGNGSYTIAGQPNGIDRVKIEIPAGAKWVQTTLGVVTVNHVGQKETIVLEPLPNGCPKQPN